MGENNVVNEYETNDAKSPRQNFLDQVKDIVCTDRANKHGPVEDSFQNIANLWNAYLTAKQANSSEPISLNVLDVALMMDLLKTARLAVNQLHLDSWLDKAGYSTCGGSLLLDPSV